MLLGYEFMTLLLIVLLMVLVGGKKRAYSVLPKSTEAFVQKNMKFLPIMMLGYGLLILPLPTSANIKSELMATETAVGFSGKTMYTMSQFGNLLKTVEDNCPADTIAKAELFFNKIEQKYEKNYASMTDADILYNSWFLYNELSKAHAQILRLHNDEELCIAKYIMYKIQYRLRNRHIMTLQTTELINDMDSYDPTELRGYEVKLEYLDRLIQLYRPYTDRLKENVVFRVANPEVYDQLAGKERVLVDRTQTLMQHIVAKVMYDLKRAGILKEKDISVLKDHIILSYQPGCEKFFGRYQVTVVYDDKGTVLDKRIDNLQLKVNMCTNFFIIKEFPFYFQKIVTHELGHHVYYFIDPDAKSFEDKCWLRDDVQNGRCTKDDFVSEYSTTLATEDYAETFMHWFLKLVTSTGVTPRLASKINHFKQLFPTVNLSQ